MSVWNAVTSENRYWRSRDWAKAVVALKLTLNMSVECPRHWSKLILSVCQPAVICYTSLALYINTVYWKLFLKKASYWRGTVCQLSSAVFLYVAYIRGWLIYLFRKCVGSPLWAMCFSCWWRCWWRIKLENVRRQKIMWFIFLFSYTYCLNVPNQNKINIQLRRVGASSKGNALMLLSPAEPRACMY